MQRVLAAGFHQRLLGRARHGLDRHRAGPFTATAQQHVLTMLMPSRQPARATFDDLAPCETSSQRVLDSAIGFWSMFRAACVFTLVMRFIFLEFSSTSLPAVISSMRTVVFLQCRTE
jgi:hypothetical protein